MALNLDGLSNYLALTCPPPRFLRDSASLLGYIRPAGSVEASFRVHTDSTSSSPGAPPTQGHLWPLFHGLWGILKCSCCVKVQVTATQNCALLGTSRKFYPGP